MKQLIEAFESAVNSHSVENRSEFTQAFNEFLADRAPVGAISPTRIVGYVSLSMTARMAVAATLPAQDQLSYGDRRQLMIATANICNVVPVLSGRTCVKQALKGVAKTYFRLNTFSPQPLVLVANETATPITWDSFEHARELLRHSDDLVHKPVGQRVSEQMDKIVSEIWPLNALDAAAYMSTEFMRQKQQTVLH